METVKLNLGDGGIAIDGYTPVDRANGQEAYPLEYEDNSVDEIRASHLLEHFGHQETLNVVRDWVRCLKPGGLLKVAVPDFDWIIERYSAGNQNDLPLEGFLMGGHVDENDRHGAIFNRGKLEHIMRLAGLRGIESWKSEAEDCAAYPLSLNLAGRKWQLDKDQLRKDVVAVITRPRFTDSDSSDCIADLMRATGIKMFRSGGVFWTQGITMVMEKAIEAGAKYILTIDFDTIFKPEDLYELYALMELNQNANAMVPVQMRRESVYALLTVGDDEGKATGKLDRDKLADDAMPIRSGHFGFTLLRADAVKNTPKPWFMPRPAEDGTWNGGRVDADVDFWLKQSDIYMANRVVVGHAQKLITWPDKNLQPVHQFVNDFHERGKPEGTI